MTSSEGVPFLTKARWNSMACVGGVQRSLAPAMLSVGVFTFRAKNTGLREKCLPLGSVGSDLKKSRSNSGMLLVKCWLMLSVTGEIEIAAAKRSVCVTIQDDIIPP